MGLGVAGPMAAVPGTLYLTSPDQAADRGETAASRARLLHLERADAAAAAGVKD